MRKGRLAQSSSEWAVAVAVVLTGIIGMQIYLMRARQGQVKAQIDSLGGVLYSPQHSVYNKLTVSSDATMTSVVGNHTINVGSAAKPKYAEMYTSTKFDTAQVSGTGGGTVAPTRTADALNGAYAQAAGVAGVSEIKTFVGSQGPVTGYTASKSGAATETFDDSFQGKHGIYEDQ